MSRGRLFAALCMILLPAGASAQRGLAVGGWGALELGVPRAPEHAPGVINRIGGSGAGTGTNVTWGLGADFFLPGVLGLDLRVRGGIFTSSGKFRSDPITTVKINPGDTATQVTEQFLLITETREFRLDQAPRLRIGERIGLDLGLSLIYRPVTDIWMTEELIRPSTASFAGTEQSRTRMMILDRTSESRRTRYGAMAALSYEIPIGRGILRPELTGRADLTSLTLEGLGIRSCDVGMGLSWLFNIPSARYSDIPPKDDGALYASIDLYAGEEGERSSTAVIMAEQTVRRQYAPILPRIFFDTGSADMPGRYVRLSPERAAAFTRNWLAGLDPAAIQRQALNIIGMRMRRDSAASLTLTGRIAAGEKDALAMKRAAGVRDYLRDVWGIAGARIEVRDDRSPAAEPTPGVDLASATAELLAPVGTEWIARDFTLPKLGLDRTIVSEAKVTGWELLVHRGGDTLAWSSGKDAGDSLPSTLDFNLRDVARPGVSVPIDAELTVEDSAGRRTVARDRIIVMQGKGEGGPSREIITCHLPSDDWNPALATANRELIGRIAGTLRPGARVTIDAPPGNDAGEHREGWDLGDVGKRLLEALRAAPVRPAELRLAERAGEGNRPADPPEAMLLDRGARVTVEQDAATGKP